MTKVYVHRKFLCGLEGTLQVTLRKLHNLVDPGASYQEAQRHEEEVRREKFQSTEENGILRCSEFLDDPGSSKPCTSK